MRGNGAVLTVESASRGNGPESRLKSHFFLAWRSGWTWVSVSRQKLDSEVCTLQSCRVANRGRKQVELEVVRLKRLTRMTMTGTDEDGDEETDGGSWQSYKRNEWKLVAGR